MLFLSQAEYFSAVCKKKKITHWYNCLHSPSSYFVAVGKARWWHTQNSQWSRDRFVRKSVWICRNAKRSETQNQDSPVLWDCQPGCWVLRASSGRQQVRFGKSGPACTDPFWFWLESVYFQRKVPLVLSDTGNWNCSFFKTKLVKSK